MKAEYIPDEGDSIKVDVWFTPEVPVSSGPAGYGGLPGLIVFVDVNEGKKANRYVHHGNARNNLKEK